jgi:hypothetical protein
MIGVIRAWIVSRPPSGHPAGPKSGSGSGYAAHTMLMKQCMGRNGLKLLWTKLPGQDCQHMTARIRQPEWDRQK